MNLRLEEIVELADDNGAIGFATDGHGYVETVYIFFSAAVATSDVVYSGAYAFAYPDGEIELRDFSLYGSDRNSLIEELLDEALNEYEAPLEVLDPRRLSLFNNAANLSAETLWEGYENGADLDL